MTTQTKARRRRQSGGIFAVGDGVWRVDVEVRRAPGEPRRRVSRTVRGTRADAERVLADLRAEHAHETAAFGVRVSAEIATVLRHRAAADRIPVAEEIRLALAAWLEVGS